MSPLLPLDLPSERDWTRRIPTLEEAYRQAEIEAERAADVVRVAVARYRFDRTPANQDAYTAADRRYDAARNAFQVASFNLLTACREAARAKREAELQSATVRMI